MRKKNLFLFVLFVTAFFIPYHVQAQVGGGNSPEIFRQEGIASWYGREFEGRPTASGEIFDSSQLTAAHPNLPFGTRVVVTNLHNNKNITVRINDRGPFVAARIIDVSRAAAEQLDMIVTGTAPVKIETLERLNISAPVTAPAQVLAPVNTTPVVSAVNTASPVSVVRQETVPVQIIQPVLTQAPVQVRLSPAININPDKMYRLQIGSYRVARNAVDVFERLKNAGLNPAYERHTDVNGELFRVVLPGVRGVDVQLTTERLGTAGFREALIREE